MGQPLEDAGKATARDEPERLLSVGEAAELCGLPHVELGRAIRDGRVMTVMGWRRGSLARLVRAGDLGALDPEALDRPLPPPVAEGDPVVSGEGKASPLGPQAGQSISYLWSQLERLRDQVRNSKEKNQRLFRDLTRSGEEVRTLLQRLEADERRCQGMEARLKSEHERVEVARTALRRARGLAAAGLLVAAGLIVVGWRGDSGEVVAAGDAAEVIADEQALAAADAEAGGSDPAAGDALPGTPASAVVEESDEPGETRAEEASLGPSPSEPEPQPEIGEPSGGEGTPPPEERLDWGLADSGAPPCAYYPLTRPGSELRSLLGPCSGPWSESHSATAGIHRRGQNAYCRHHWFFVRTLGDSLARAREVAAFSEREGLVPPLVKLRVDRSGAAFLRRRVPAWLESGFEAGLASQAGGHRLLSLGEGDAWEITSWVRYLDEGGVEHHRPFRLQLELADGPLGDRLSAFEWL